MKPLGKVIVVFTSLFVVACTTTTPLNQIDKFGESTSALTEKTDELITEYNESQVEVALHFKMRTHIPNRNNLQLEDLATIGYLFDGDEKKELAIYKANSSLGAYAKSIRLLAQSGNRADIAKASVSFVSSLDGMQQSYQELLGDKKATFFSDRELGFIAAAIDAVGSAIAEEKKRGALKKIITEADPHIATLIDEIVKQIDQMDYNSQLSTNRSLILQSKITDYNNRVEAGYYATKPDDQYQELFRLWRDAQSVIVTSKEIRNLVEALQEVKKQHAKLAQEVGENRFSSDAVVAAIKDLEKKRKRFEDFEESIVTCDKVKINDEGVPECDESAEGNAEGADNAGNGE
ncbi:hypothetical protein [Haliea salexigens]|uniref:hypothetical protein n=1 Tax=Haliea salexigens TaxID=287487 RepID=UPI00041B1304|nr:hypothetical protein [Haliea salexigens]